ncbi:ankyrin repeat and LEM domain-containing protein 2 homolog [Drosophila nasuta]|uniref:ankyrin repeat and LEM domain-containing protein 2 homolog n=1 Tax=Drosophila nasuta TaxID=42062 RepID=UPI00295E9C64|nr:ankyrin repeat and LEM domain-containing protein 2 homolog [Drosophila nasuta]XP_060661499.1 ankyrin repeat and LEM domain-containing protein 2 homolog [Drosophila nasuta]
MSFFGVYIPPSNAGFEGTTAQCAGSIAAENIKILPTTTTPNGTNQLNESMYEDPDYPPDSPLWLIFTEKSKALDMLRHYKEARLREFPNREQAESYVQFGFESIESLKRYGKAKPTSKPVQMPTTSTGSSNSYKTSYSGSDSPLFSSSPTNCSSSSPMSNNGSNNIISSSSSSSNSNNIITSTSGGSSISSNNVISSSNNSSSSSSISSLNAERQPFRAPTKQELVEFRKQIEAGNLERVKRIVWDNPRYLISSGDTPTSLKEGFRYNAMHICAQCNQASIAEFILKTISDREFTQLYAGKKSSGDMCAALNENLLDYYLNMPDKGRGETPLHFASKNGHASVAEVLIMYRQCKSLKNTEGKYPKEIICQRAQNATTLTYKKLDLLLSDPHFVPVLRTMLNTVPPFIGQPFTPHDPPPLQYKTEESDRLNVDLQICAMAGPMSRDQAFNFYRRWKTPPRLGSNVISPLAGSPYISPMKTPNKSLFNRSSDQLSIGRRVLFSPTTPNKSLNCETNGNRKQQQLEVDTSSQTQTQDETEDNIENNNNNDCAYKGTPSGKTAAMKPKQLYNMSTPMRQVRSDLLLEYRCGNNSSLRADESMDGGCGGSNFSLNVSNLNDSFRERHIKNSDIEKGLEVVGRQLARQEQMEWREYWDFLDTFIDIASPAGLTRLESYLAGQLEKSDQLWNMSQMQNCLDFITDRNKAGYSSVASRSNDTGSGTGVITQVMTPYTCVEKSLQVFAKRITKTLINNISNMVSINDTLLSELKRLKSLIVSFKDDARFISVDFTKVHSRIAHLVASYIAHSMEDTATLHYQLLQMLRKLLQLNGDRREHLHCVCASMLQTLKQATPTMQLPDVLKTEELCSAAWQLEQCCACLWDANLSRKTSRRKRTESLRAQAHEISNATTTSATTTTAATLTAAAVSLSNNIGVVHPVAKTSNNSTSSSNSNRNFTSYRYSESHSDDDDIFADDVAIYYECCNNAGAADSSEDEEVFYTPPESRSPRLSCDLEPRYELFIFGNEPTKRDLDVLNAVFHVKIEKEALPLVYAWRTAMESFSTAEMDLFPSPKSVQRTHKPSFIGTPPNYSISADGTSTSNVHRNRLLCSPKLNAVVARLAEQKTVVSQSQSPPPPPQSERMVVVSSPMPSPMPTLATVAAATVSQSFQTPLNKVRGLFSKFRETRQEDSPMMNSPEYVNINSRFNNSLFDDKD